MADGSLQGKSIKVGIACLGVTVALFDIALMTWVYRTPWYQKILHVGGMEWESRLLSAGCIRIRRYLYLLSIANAWAVYGELQKEREKSDQLLKCVTITPELSLRLIMDNLY